MGGGSRCCRIWICWNASASGASISPGCKHSIDPGKTSRRAAERMWKTHRDEPQQNRHEHHDGTQLFDETQAKQDADGDPPSPRLRFIEPFPERQRGGHPQQKPGRIRVDQVGLPIKSWHHQQRASQ